VEPQQDQVSQPQEDGQEPGQVEQTTLDAEALLREVKALRREAANWRTKLRHAEEAEAERQRSEMTELDRIKADLEAERQARAQAEQRQRDQLIRTQVIAAAAKAGFNDPEDAFRMLDVTTFEVDDAGKVDGLDSALQALAKSKPYLVKSSGTISPTNPSGGPQKASDEQLRKELFGTRRTPLFDGGGVFQEK
jgi:hypothetical protein